MDQSGNYELFDSHGIHPTYGIPLTPITQQIISQIKQKLIEDKRRKQEKAERDERQKREEAERLEKQRLEELKKQEEEREAQKREEYLNRYLLSRSFVNILQEVID